MGQNTRGFNIQNETNKSDNSYIGKPFQLAGRTLSNSWSSSSGNTTFNLPYIPPYNTSRTFEDQEPTTYHLTNNFKHKLFDREPKTQLRVEKPAQEIIETILISDSPCSFELLTPEELRLLPDKIFASPANSIKEEPEDYLNADSTANNNSSDVNKSELVFHILTADKDGEENNSSQVSSDLRAMPANDIDSMATVLFSEEATDAFNFSAEEVATNKIAEKFASTIEIASDVSVLPSEEAIDNPNSGASDSLELESPVNTTQDTESLNDTFNYDNAAEESSDLKDASTIEIGSNVTVLSSEAIDIHNSVSADRLELKCLVNPTPAPEILNGSWCYAHLNTFNKESFAAEGDENMAAEEINVFKEASIESGSIVSVLSSQETIGKQKAGRSDSLELKYLMNPRQDTNILNGSYDYEHSETFKYETLAGEGGENKSVEEMNDLEDVSIESGSSVSVLSSREAIDKHNSGSWDSLDRNGLVNQTQDTRTLNYSYNYEGLGEWIDQISLESKSESPVAHFDDAEAESDAAHMQLEYHVPQSTSLEALSDTENVHQSSELECSMEKLHINVLSDILLVPAQTETIVSVDESLLNASSKPVEFEADLVVQNEVIIESFDSEEEELEMTECSNFLRDTCDIEKIKHYIASDHKYTQKSRVITELAKSNCQEINEHKEIYEHRNVSLMSSIENYVDKKSLTERVMKGTLLTEEICEIIGQPAKKNVESRKAEVLKKNVKVIQKSLRCKIGVMKGNLDYLKRIISFKKIEPVLVSRRKVMFVKKIIDGAFASFDQISSPRKFRNRRLTRVANRKLSTAHHFQEQPMSNMYPLVPVDTGAASDTGLENELKMKKGAKDVISHKEIVTTQKQDAPKNKLKRKILCDINTIYNTDIRDKSREGEAINNKATLLLNLLSNKGSKKCRIKNDTRDHETFEFSVDRNIISSDKKENICVGVPEKKEYFSKNLRRFKDRFENGISEIIENDEYIINQVFRNLVTDQALELEEKSLQEQVVLINQNSSGSDKIAKTNGTKKSEGSMANMDEKSIADENNKLNEVIHATVTESKFNENIKPLNKKLAEIVQIREHQGSKDNNANNMFEIVEDVTKNKFNENKEPLDENLARAIKVNEHKLSKDENVNKIRSLDEDVTKNKCTLNKFNEVKEPSEENLARTIKVHEYRVPKDPNVNKILGTDEDVTTNKFNESNELLNENLTRTIKIHEHKGSADENVNNILGVDTNIYERDDNVSNSASFTKMLNVDENNEFSGVKMLVLSNNVKLDNLIILPNKNSTDYTEENNTKLNFKKYIKVKLLKNVESFTLNDLPKNVTGNENKKCPEIPDLAEQSGDKEYIVEKSIHKKSSKNSSEIILDMTKNSQECVRKLSTEQENYTGFRSQEHKCMDSNIVIVNTDIQNQNLQNVKNTKTRGVHLSIPLKKASTDFENAINELDVLQNNSQELISAAKEDSLNFTEDCATFLAKQAEVGNEKIKDEEPELVELITKIDGNLRDIKCYESVTYYEKPEMLQSNTENDSAKYDSEELDNLNDIRLIIEGAIKRCGKKIAEDVLETFSDIYEPERSTSRHSPFEPPILVPYYDNQCCSKVENCDLLRRKSRRKDPIALKSDITDWLMKQNTSVEDFESATFVRRSSRKRHPPDFYSSEKYNKKINEGTTGILSQFTTEQTLEGNIYPNKTQKRRTTKAETQQRHSNRTSKIQKRQ